MAVPIGVGWPAKLLRKVGITQPGRRRARKRVREERLTQGRVFRDGEILHVNNLRRQLGMCVVPDPCRRRRCAPLAHRS